VRLLCPLTFAPSSSLIAWRVGCCIAPVDFIRGWEERLARPRIQNFSTGLLHRVLAIQDLLISSDGAGGSCSVTCLGVAASDDGGEDCGSSGYFTGVVAGRHGSAAIRGQTLKCRRLESTSM